MLLLYPKPLGVSGPSFFSLDFPVFVRRIRVQVRKQFLGSRSDILDRLAKRRLVRLRRLLKAAYLAHVLQGGRMYFLAACGRVKVKQWLDVAAHGIIIPF